MKYHHVINIATSLWEETYFDFTLEEPTRTMSTLAKAKKVCWNEKS